MRENRAGNQKSTKSSQQNKTPLSPLIIILSSVEGTHLISCTDGHRGVLFGHDDRLCGTTRRSRIRLP